MTPTNKDEVLKAVRQWWIRPEASYNGDFIFDEDPQSYWPMTTGECVHVIEFSAFTRLLDANAALVEALEQVQYFRESILEKEFDRESITLAEMFFSIEEALAANETAMRDICSKTEWVRG